MANCIGHKKLRTRVFSYCTINLTAISPAGKVNQPVPEQHTPDNAVLTNQIDNVAAYDRAFLHCVVNESGNFRFCIRFSVKLFSDRLFLVRPSMRRMASCIYRDSANFWFIPCAPNSGVHV